MPIFKVNSETAKLTVGRVKLLLTMDFKELKDTELYGDRRVQRDTLEPIEESLTVQLLPSCEDITGKLSPHWEAVARDQFN